jgi:hypothetical protein
MNQYHKAIISIIFFNETYRYVQDDIVFLFIIYDSSFTIGLIHH